MLKRLSKGLPTLFWRENPGEQWLIQFGIQRETLRRYVQFRKEGINLKSANIRFKGRLVFSVRKEDVLTEYTIDLDGKTL